MYTDECGVILLTLQGIILGACMYVYTQAEISMAEKASKYTAYTCVFLIMYVSILVTEVEKTVYVCISGQMSVCRASEICTDVILMCLSVCI